MHGERKIDAIVKAEPHDQKILVGRSVFETKPPVGVRVAVESKNDGCKTASGGVGIAEGVIPNTRCCPRYAKIPEVETLVHGCSCDAGRKAFRNARITDYQDFRDLSGFSVPKPI